MGDYPAARTSARRASLWLRLALALGILAGCRDGPTAPQEPTGPVLAYRSSSEIGLVDGTSVIATALRQTVDLPTVSDPAGDPMLLAARSGTAIIARVESAPSPFGGPDTLYAVRGTGAPTRLGQADANTPVSVARLSPDGASLAYALYRRSSNTCGTAAVAVVNADGSQETFDVAAPDPDVGSQITHVWWPKAGPLNLSLGTCQCAQPQTFRTVVWQLTGDRLDQTTPVPLRCKPPTWLRASKRSSSLMERRLRRRELWFSRTAGAE